MSVEEIAEIHRALTALDARVTALEDAHKRATELLSKLDAQLESNEVTRHYLRTQKRQPTPRLDALLKEQEEGED